MTVPGREGPTSGRRTVRIGVTGPIGCGKSQVVQWLADLGATPIDADAFARAVTAPGQPTHDAVIGQFGPAVMLPDGTLDRTALARLVFGDPAKLHQLETIVHPAVRERILEALDAAERASVAAVAIEAIKLVEGGLAALCDEVWLVDCDAASQRARLAGRGTLPEDAERRIAAQAGLAERLRPAATRVIDTSGSLVETRALVVTALAEALAAGR